MPQDLTNLNKEQETAVRHEEGPLLIVAGAGTGKTTVITRRIVELIEKGKAKPEEILAVTFTDKAAGEMEERVDKLLPFGYTDLWISTFHAFCERVLRDFALDIGVPSDFKILDQTSAWLLVRRNLDKFHLNYYKPLGNPIKFVQALVSHFSHCKDQEIYPEDYLKYADNLKTRDDLPEDGDSERIKEVANAYHVYQRLLLENSALDFGDLINYCLRLFQKRPLILKRFREKFKYILVDEFQDTNFAQYELIKLIAAPKNNLTVCADDDQAIYRWRGASFGNIVQFKKDFPQAKQISLVKNYRSTQNILDLAYKFIKANDPDRLEFVNKINKKLIAQNNGGGIIEHLHEKGLDEEVGKTIEKILEILKKDKEATYNDFAILVRANDAAKVFTRALERAGLPYQFLASRGLYSKPIILDIISYFKLLDNYHESPAVFRILCLPFLEIPQEEIMKLTQYAQRKAKSLYESMQELPLVPGLTEEAQEKITFILSLIKKHSSLAREKSVSEILVAFLQDSGYLKYLTCDETSSHLTPRFAREGEEDKSSSSAFAEARQSKEQLDLLNQFHKRIRSFEEASHEASLKNFMAEMNLEIESGEKGKLEFDPEEGPDMIKVMTVHGAKGLEFKYVFLVNMVDKRFPTMERKDPIEVPDALIKDIKPEGDIHLQEERRLCYVAMTRAKSGLYFTSAQDYGGARKKRLSRFMVELGYKDKFQIPNHKSQKNSKFEISNLKHETAREKKSLEIKYLPGHFSFSQLAAFAKCPLQYKFSFILKVPVRGRAVFSFGKTMHKTLYMFLKKVYEIGEHKQDNLFRFEKKEAKPGKKGGAFGGGLDALLEIYETSWLGEWFENEKQKEDYYKNGRKLLKDIYEEFSKSPPKILKINNAPALELPFNLKIGEHTLRGQIDRIDETKEGAAIVDYKTGNPKEKLSAEDKEQLLIYQIAAREVLGIKPKELIYHYLEDNKKVSFLGTEKELEEEKEKIVKEIGDIKNSDFSATPGWQCAFCDFKDICDFADR